MKRSSSTIIRLYVLGVFLLLLLGVLAGKLWYVQVARGEEYTARISKSSQVTVRIPAVRGEILDRNGIPLAQNRVSFEVEFYLPDMVRAYRNEKGSVPITTYRGVTYGMADDKNEADVRKIVEEMVIPELEELGLAHDYNSERLQVHFRTETEVPWTYIDDLDFETMARFSERTIGLPGVRVAQRPVRNYPYGALGSHFLGYVGRETEPNPEEVKKFNFYQPDIEGKAHIEQFLDAELKGTAGAKILQRNAKGVIEGEVGMVEPIRGNDVYLTVDARIQYITEEALRVVGRGAAVVVDPNNGDILAMASVPSFDPNVFIPSISAQDWATLNDDETDPLLNRSVSGYPPGSTYKIPIGIAGILSGIDDKRFPCAGGISFGNTHMACWIAGKGRTHGSLDLKGGIKNSCNGFFYRYAIDAGIDSIVKVGNIVGLGQKLGVPISGETPGILPGPEWLVANYPNDHWRDGYTANTSIGQGFVLATPLQMAMVTAAVANGGTAYAPRMVKKIVSADGAEVKEEPAQIRGNMPEELGLSEEAFEKIRKGMWQVVNEGGGTARTARIKGVEVAGKTGTAQYKRNGKPDNIAWFIAFAPYENPKFAICVMVQGGHAGGAVAAPIAAKILEDSLKLDEGEEPTLAALAPAAGNFKFVRSVDFGRDIPAALASSSDGETSETSSGRSAVSQQESAPRAQPVIREDADQRGKVKNKQRESPLEKFFLFKLFKKKNR